MALADVGHVAGLARTAVDSAFQSAIGREFNVLIMALAAGSETTKHAPERFETAVNDAIAARTIAILTVDKLFGAPDGQ